MFAPYFSQFLLFLFSIPGNGQESGQINFGASPDLNDEESSSFHMPERLKCDGCQIVAHLFYAALQKAEQKLPKGKLLSESEIIDATESVCQSEFKEYGVTDWNGRKRMKGPGLETDNVPGVSQSGGKWPVRLQQLCNTYIDELGEDYIYRKYRRAAEHSDQWPQTFRKFLCEDTGHRLAHCKKNKGEL